MAWRAEAVDGPLPGHRQRAFQAWLKRPEHAAAYERAEGLWRDLDWSQVLNEEALKVEPLMIRPVQAARASATSLSMTRRGLGLGFGVAATMACAAVLAPGLARFFEGAQPGLRLATEVGEIREVVLQDGSRLALGGRSAAIVHMTDRRREVELLAGDAWFDVTPDADRPFSVRADDLTATVLGTVFEVRRNGSGMQVAVAEGRVRVDPPTGEAVFLKRGQGLRAWTGSAPVLFDVAPGEAGRWRRHRFSYLNAPLAQVIEDLNRYHPPGVRLSTPHLGDLRVSAAFRLEQLEAAMRGISVSHDLRVIRTPDGGFLLSPASSEKG